MKRSVRGEYLVGSILAIAVAGLYVWRLNSAPSAVGGDEASFVLHARSIAASGRDVDGRILPLFFRLDAVTWYQPILVYLMAPVLAVAPVAEWSIRTPTALIGILDMFLVYAVGKRILGSTRYALVAAIALGTAPAHFVLARMALDYICPLPFVLGWLWCLLAAAETDSPIAAAAGGLSLGIGFFSYVASWVMMPFYCTASIVTLWATGRRRLLLAMLGGFLLPMVPFMLWARDHQDVIHPILERYSVLGGQHVSLLSSLRQLAHYLVIEERLSLYWKYFDPVYLFLVGSSDPALGTRTAGVFITAVGILIVFGIYDVISRRSDRAIGVLLLAGFVTAPLAPVLVDSGNATQREMVVLPFGALLAAVGARHLLERDGWKWRAGAWAIAAILLSHFAYFSYDYFGKYQVRAAVRIDPINLGEVARTVLAGEQRPPIPRFYLSESLDDGPARWQFYVAKYRRDDVLPRTWMLDASARHQWSLLDQQSVPFDGNSIPVGSAFILNAGDPAIMELVGDRRCCELARTVAGANGSPASVIIRKLR